MNLSESEEKFLLNLEKNLEKVYIVYISVAISLCGAIVRLIIGLVRGSEKSLNAALFLGILGVSLFSIMRAYQKNVQNSIKNERNDKGFARDDLDVYTVGVPSEGWSNLTAGRPVMIKSQCDVTSKAGQMGTYNELQKTRILGPLNPRTLYFEPQVEQLEEPQLLQDELAVLLNFPPTENAKADITR